MGYRKKWEQLYGPIPKDEFGRTYEIHHIDGNKKNNDISNLKCLSIQEHYELHLAQGDYAAALRIAQRMTISIEEKSKLMSLSNKKRLAEGRHPFLDEIVEAKRYAAIERKINKGVHGTQNKDILKKCIQTKRSLYNHEDLSSFGKKGWTEYKNKNPNHTRTIPGSIAGAKKIKGTKWFHKPDGSHLRTTEDDIRIKDGWILGRFNPNLK